MIDYSTSLDVKILLKNFNEFNLIHGISKSEIRQYDYIGSYNEQHFDILKLQKSSLNLLKLSFNK